MPSTTTPALIWDEATESQALDLASRFERAWKSSEPGRRPEPRGFLGDDESGRAGLLLALLRVDLAQRRKAGEDARPERYRKLYPELPADGLVALLYEDYCLREECGESPGWNEYEDRFPDLADRLREILDIHDLVAEPGSTCPDGEDHAIPFPEAGQTIAGFRLVEELGRGSFARVFLAQERQLADRLVALKVSRTGSREPQTLARLQHTHIVPVHSYRTDPATGLHLLCMPYFGRITLARLLAEPSVKVAPGGAELLAALDRLGPSSHLERGSLLPLLKRSEGGSRLPHSKGSLATSARTTLAQLPHARAVAWWGARLAEGLQHAHDRGVLHRDVKPSNVLIAGDGMPMLLDFNLAREPGLDGVSLSKLGGTLAYMAPEHLDAVSEGRDGGIDHRADIYSLGMVLFEALGSKPLSSTSSAPTLADSLTWLLEDRRREAPRLAGGLIAIPRALEAVVRRCLAPDPDDRYATAADLAIDLQAVSDDDSLVFASEPYAPRAIRWWKRSRTLLAIVAIVLLAVSALVVMLFRSQAESLRLEIDARDMIRDGIRSSSLGEFQVAAAQFAQASAILKERSGLRTLLEEATRRREVAEADLANRKRADAFFEKAEPLRFALLGFVGDRTEASRQLQEALKPLSVFESESWVDRADVRRLDEGRRNRLRREVDDLLFFWVIAAAMDRGKQPELGRIAVSYCDQALRSTDRKAPWRALRDWWSAPEIRRPTVPPDLGSEQLASVCFRWSLLAKLGHEPDRALAWLDRATWLEPENYWHQYALCYELALAGRTDRALAACDTAIALRPDSPWARKTRAEIRVGLGQWDLALQDLGEAIELCHSSREVARIRLDRAMIRQRLGDFGRARADYAVAIPGDDGGPTARDARRNLARLEADSGAIQDALALYDGLIAEDPTDSRSRRGRIRLWLKHGHPPKAEAELTLLIDSTPWSEQGSLLAERALTRLAMNRPIEAEADATLACQLEPSGLNARLRDRAMLASNRNLDSWPTRPDAFDAWPDNGPPLRADLRSAAERLDRSDRMVRSVLLSAAFDHSAALTEADRMVTEAPRSVPARQLRAAIRHRAGRHADALEDLAFALRETPEGPDLIELRGRIRIDLGEFEAGLVDLKVAAERGSRSAINPSMAKALAALRRFDRAAEVWTRLIDENPLDAQAYLGLARARRSLKEWDRALAALEQASGLVDDRSPILRRTALVYATCLPARPDRLPRLVGLGRRMGIGRLLQR